MSESGDYTVTSWVSGHDFSSARKAYDAHAGRSYATAKSTGKTARDLIAPKLVTQARRPLIIVVDQTGSMLDWPGVMASKFPYMEHEIRTEYMGEDAETAFLAIGDANNAREQYPLQVRPFCKGKAYETRLKELVMEGDGGGTQHETYELAALYCANNVEMPNATHPVMIFIGDEEPYDHISKEHAKTYCGIDAPHALPTKQVFAALKRKFAVYFIRKPYGHTTMQQGGAMDETNRQILAAWQDLLGAEHVVDLPEAARVVDVIFGILANEVGKYDYFVEEITGRQTKTQVAMVTKSLETIHRGLIGEDAGSSKEGKKHKAITERAGASMTRGGDAGKSTKPLV